MFFLRAAKAGLTLAAVVVAICSSLAPAQQAVEIRVEAKKTHQSMEGFGATTWTLYQPTASPAFKDLLGDSLGPMRERVLDAVYGQVRLTMGNLGIGPVETAGSEGNPGNDNDDPAVIDWSGFDTRGADGAKKLVVDLAAKHGFDNYSLAGNIDWRWRSAWMGELYKKDHARGLEECAEYVEAAVTHWQKINGTLPRTIHLFNEPTSGNGELRGGNAETVRDIVKCAGRRLRQRGFKDIKFVVPNEETVSRSLACAKVILEDEEARGFVAAVGYHCYPYGSPYASVPRILAASGRGKPHEGSVAERAALRELCAKYNLPAWMTEVSHGEVQPQSFDHLRGRAIHIHDELLYADAAAYYGMLAFWDKKSHDAHYAGRSNAGLYSEQDSIVLADNDKQEVLITGIGYAIGHYARWIKRDAVRLEATSSDPLVQVTAFNDAASGRLVLVIINNNSEAKSLDVRVSDLAVKGPVTGEQSVAHHYWTKIAELTPAAADRLTIDLPAMSVTTLAAGAK